MNLELLNRGFIPEEICLNLPDTFSDVEQLALELPKVLANEQIESRVLRLEVEKNVDDLTVPQLERAMLVYSYIGHAFMWGKKNDLNVIPPQIAKTWHKISTKLERPPILSYASYALNNWKMLDSSQPFDLENIVIVQNFLGGVDEDWFIMIHVAIEYEAKEILSALKKYFFDSGVATDLEDALQSIKKINHTMNRMPEKCDPFIYYNRVRPYIFGWKNNPTTPEGVIYEGVDEYDGKPQIFRGETGAQSSIVPMLDALLGVTHSDDPLKEYLDEIKLRLKVSQVVGKSVQLKKRGKEFIGLSPFKNEKSPSFTVNDEKEFYHCFSSGEHGNIFDFLMKTKSIGFGEAVRSLAAEAGMQPYRFSNFDKKKDLRFQTYKNIFNSIFQSNS